MPINTLSLITSGAEVPVEPLLGSPFLALEYVPGYTLRSAPQFDEIAAEVWAAVEPRLP